MIIKQHRDVSRTDKCGTCTERTNTKQPRIFRGAHSRKNEHFFFSCIIMILNKSNVKMWKRNGMIFPISNSTNSSQKLEQQKLMTGFGVWMSKKRTNEQTKITWRRIEATKIEKKKYSNEDFYKKINRFYHVPKTGLNIVFLDTD